MFRVGFDNTRLAGGCGCCGENVFSTVYKPPMPSFVGSGVQRYCDSIPNSAEVNPELIGEIIRDLHCVFEKTYGRKNSAEARFRSLASEVEELKDDLACCECCKEELENELIKLHPELKALQFALEEEIQKRACLESIINQLRAQLARADAMLDSDCRDKNALQNRIRDLETQLNKLQDIIDCLSGEKEDLERNCMKAEETGRRLGDSSNMAGQRMQQLEEALAKCCKANEELQRELCNIAKERDCLVTALEAARIRELQLLDEFDRQRRLWDEDRDRLEQMISDLRKAVECLTAQNQEICDKMREVVAAHHRELDKLKKESEKYKRMYDQCEEERCKADTAHKRCQEDLRNKINEMRTNPITQQTEEDTNANRSRSRPTYINPCSEILARINGRPWGGGGGGAGMGFGGGGTRGSGGGYYTSTNTTSGGANNNNTSGANEQQQQNVRQLQKQLEVETLKASSQQQRIEELEAQVEELKAQSRSRRVDNSTSDGSDTDSVNDRIMELQRVVNDERDRSDKLRKELKSTMKSLELERRSKQLLERSISKDMEKLRVRELLEESTHSFGQGGEDSQIQDRLRRMEDNLLESTAQSRKLEMEIEVTEQRNRTLEEMIENEQKLRVKLQRDLDHAEDVLRNENQEKEILQEKVRTLDQNNNELRTNQEELLRLRGMLQEDYSYKHKVEELKAKLEFTEAEKIRSEQEAKRRLQSVQSESTNIRQQLQEHIRECESAKLRIQDLELSCKLAENATAELYQVRKELSEAAKYKQELGILKTQLSNARDDANELELLRGKLQVAEEEKRQLESAYNDLKQSAREKEVAVSDLRAKLHATTTSSTTDVNTLRRQLENAGVQMSELENARSQLLFTQQEKHREVEGMRQKLFQMEERLAETEELRRKLGSAEAKLMEMEALKSELRTVQQNKMALEAHLQEFQGRLAEVEPKLEELSKHRQVIEDRLSVMAEENSRLRKANDEKSVALEVTQRELRDVSSMWETEVKAKGILAEKIAKYERISAHTESKTKQEAEHYERMKDKARQIKAELKTEREQSGRLKMKVDLLKEQLRTARDQLQEMASDPHAQKLADHLEKQSVEHARVLHQIGKEREALMAEFYKMGQTKSALENEVAQLRVQLNHENSDDKNIIEQLMTTKERLESEMLTLKTLVNKRYVEKSVLDSIRKEHEGNLIALKSKFETQMEQELANKLNQIGVMLDNQNKDRVMIDTMRNTNENSVRNELNSMVKNMKLDIERLNGLLKAREEEITSLRTCVTKFKDKVATETMEKNELIRRLQRLSTSQESIVI